MTMIVNNKPLSLFHTESILLGLYEQGIWEAQSSVLISKMIMKQHMLGTIRLY